MKRWGRLIFPRSYIDRQRRAGFFFILPAVVFFTLVYLVPLIQSVTLSFHRIVPGGASRFVGLSLYQKVLTDPDLLGERPEHGQPARDVRADHRDPRACGGARAAPYR